MTAVSVIVPLYRSRDTVAALHQRLCAALATEALEILFVDDHCPERSFDAAAELSRTDTRVRAVRLAQNVGQQRAVLLGLGAARGAHVVVMDADLQDEPEVVPGLLARARAGADVVFATRRGHYESVARLITSRLFKGVMTALTGLPPNAGMFFVAAAPVVQRVTARTTPTPYVVFLAAANAERVDAVPTARAKRPVGGSAYSGLARLRVALAALRCVADSRLGRPDTTTPPTIEASSRW